MPDAWLSQTSFNYNQSQQHHYTHPSNDTYHRPLNIKNHSLLRYFLYLFLGLFLWLFLGFFRLLVVLSIDIIQAKVLIFLKGAWTELNFESGILIGVEGIGDEGVREGVD